MKMKYEFLGGSYIWELKIWIYKRSPLYCSEEHMEYEIRMAVHLRKRKKPRKIHKSLAVGLYEVIPCAFGAPSCSPHVVLKSHANKTLNYKSVGKVRK